MYKVVDLFAGAGGMSLGFVRQGHFQIVGVVENNASALTTYKNNHARGIKFDTDIRDIDFTKYAESIGAVDIIIGGPPCQGFSNANRQKSKFISLNNALVKRYVDAVLTLKPIAFVMENVAMLKSDVHKFFDSDIDHEEMTQLGIKMRDETYVIMNCNLDGNQLLDMLRDQSLVKYYELSEDLFNRIKLIKRYYNKPTKLQNYFTKYSSCILKGLQEYYVRFFDDKIGNVIKPVLSSINAVYESKNLNEEFKKNVDSFIDFARALALMNEIFENRIIFELVEDDSNKIVARLKSYTVYDYLQKRLGKEYNLRDSILNAVDYGVAQERRRFILIGINRSLNKEINFPKSLDSKKHTVRDAIFDLEEYEPAKLVTSEAIVRKAFSENLYTRLLQCDEKVIYNHVNTDTRDIALERFRQIQQGKNFHSLDSKLKENTYSDPTRTQNTIYQRLVYDLPCGTVVNVRKSMWIHPVKDRAISIREAARLQSFPDSYIFYGSKDSQYQQIGNAVPPLLSEEIANCIYNLIN